MAYHISVIKMVLNLQKEGYPMIKIAKTLNLHIEEVADIINQYSNNNIDIQK